MSVTFDLPNDIEACLRTTLGNLNEAAKEAALVELYRQGTVSHVDFTRAMGITRLEAEALLKKHQVVDDLLTVDEYDQAATRLRTAGES